MRGYYKKIKGKEYDGHLIRIADEAVKGKGDGRISLHDAKRVLAAVKDSNSYTDIEKNTMSYIRDNYKFTEEADTWFRTEIRKWAATKTNAAQAHKAKPAAKKKSTAPKKKKTSAPMRKPAAAKPRPASHRAPAPRKEPVYQTETYEDRARSDERYIGREEENKSSKVILAVVFVAFLAIAALIMFYPRLQKLLTKGDDKPLKQQPSEQVRPVQDEAAKQAAKSDSPAKIATAPSGKDAGIAKRPAGDLPTQTEQPPKFESYKAEGRENYDYYVVKPKETLVSIGEKLTGKYWDWEKLFNANKKIIKDPRVVYAGQIIKIPDNMKKQIDRRQSKESVKSTE